MFSLPPSSSPFGKINWTDLYKALRGSVLVFVAAFVLGGLEAVNSLVQTGDLGSLDLARSVLISTFSFLLETARRYFTNYAR